MDLRPISSVYVNANALIVKLNDLALTENRFALNSFSSFNAKWICVKEIVRTLTQFS